MPLPGQERLGKQNQLPSVRRWVDDKILHDKVSDGLWRVHNKIYDLSPFMDSHPGGSHWLRRTKGMDITDFY
jgi:cytochrome b involved in lipid metabolism